VGLNPKLWNGKRVLVTGHTGFKGSWLTLILKELGAEVVGLALPPSGSRSLYLDAEIGDELFSEIFQDIRDEIGVNKALQ
jgi:CDP-glucose 4,6-dehydratase